MDETTRTAARAVLAGLVASTPGTLDALDTLVGDLVSAFATQHGLQTEDTGRGGYDETQVFSADRTEALAVSTSTIFGPDDEG